MPMFSQGIVTPVREKERQRGGDDLFNKGALHDVERSVLPAADNNSGLTRHSTKMAQNGSRVIGKDIEVPSMPAATERKRELIIASFL